MAMFACVRERKRERERERERETKNRRCGAIVGHREKGERGGTGRTGKHLENISVFESLTSAAFLSFFSVTIHKLCLVD